MSITQLLRQPGGTYTDDAPDGAPPVDLDRVADAVPRAEPLHPGANEPYTVFGREYVPLKTLAPYRRQGTASWYGRKFHGQRTAGGDVYDMYAMTASHPTLPIPSYARITNLENKRSIVVRINDRGPFASGRIMDVSYAAAYRLGFAASGSAQIELETVLVRDQPPPLAGTASPVAPEPVAVVRPIAAPPAPATAALPAAESALPRLAAAEPAAPARATPEPAPPAATAPASAPAGNERASTEAEAPIPIAAEATGIFVQLGAFSLRANAEAFRARLASRIDGIGAPLVLTQRDAIYRVQLGPYRDRASANTAARQVRELLELRPVVVVR